MSKPLEVLVDGQLCADAWTVDRGLHYGDGLFETMSTRDGQLRFAQLHRSRLEEGCRRLGIKLSQDPPWDQLWDQLRQVAQRHGSAVVKLLVTRGDALARGYATLGTEQARTLILVYGNAVQGNAIPAMVRVVTLQGRLGENPLLAGMKHCNRLEQVLARAELQPSGAFEGLLGSSSGRLISGTMSNVFLELHGEWVTPMLDQCGIAGVMRAVVLREAAQCGLRVRVASLPLSVVDECGGMFLTNARLGPVPVHELNGRSLKVDERVRALAARVDILER